MAKDYYQILGVARDADEKEIKKAYRRLAREYHPDANKSGDAETRFKEISQAYQVLSNQEKRELYDQFGSDFERVPPGGAPPPPGTYPGGGYPGGYPGGASVDFSDIFNQVRRGQPGQPTGNVPHAGVEDANIGGIFEEIFGGRGRGRGGEPGGVFNFRGRQRGPTVQRGPQKGQDVEQPISILLPESVRGTQRSLQLTIRDPISGDTHHRNLTVKIPAGVRDGARVRAARQGAPGHDGGPNGDLFLKINIESHPFWRREGDNLHCEVPITFFEAALGAAIEVPTINGTVQMKVPAGTQSGQIFRLSGRGVPHLSGGGQGDQFVKVKVEVPKNLAGRQQELIEELARLSDDHPRAQLPKGM